MNRARFFQLSRRRNRRGMTLIEVIIALTIFTTVALSIVLALSSSFDAAEARNDVDSVLRGLENRLALIHSSRLLPGVTDLPDDGSGISYRLEVVQVQLVDQKKASVPNIYRATISATWKSHGDVNERDVSELVYQP